MAFGRSKRDRDVHVVRRARPLAPSTAQWLYEEWAVMHRGVLWQTAGTQRAAEQVGRELAKTMRCELVVHGTARVGGRIRKKDSHGNDPRRSRG